PPPPQGPAPLGVSQVDPPPLVEPLEISSDSSRPAEGGDPAADDTVATRRSPLLKTPPGGATRAGGAGAASPGGTAGAGGTGATDAGGAGGATGGARGTRAAGGAAGPRGALTGGAGAAGAGGAGGAGGGGGATGGARGTGASARGAGAAGASGAAGATGAGGAVGAGGARAGGTRGAACIAGAGGARAGGTGGTGTADGSNQSQPQLLPGSPLPNPAPHTEVTHSLTERREPKTLTSTPVRARHVARPRPPAVPSTHGIALHPASVPQHVVLVNGSKVLASSSLGQRQRLGQMYGSSSRPSTVGELLDKLCRAAGNRCDVAVNQGFRQLQLTGLGDGWAVDQEEQFDREVDRVVCRPDK
ncbi:unnamed protein product, partial [Closterium sp. NIES-53]